MGGRGKNCAGSSFVWLAFAIGPTSAQPEGIGAKSIAVQGDEMVAGSGDVFQKHRFWRVGYGVADTSISNRNG